MRLKLKLAVLFLFWNNCVLSKSFQPYNDIASKNELESNLSNFDKLDVDDLLVRNIY